MADLGDEVDVFLVLRLLTLTPLVFPIEVEETAGQDEVPAGVRGPAVKAKDKLLPGAKENDDNKISSGKCSEFVCYFNKILIVQQTTIQAQHRHQVVALENTHR